MRTPLKQIFPRGEAPARHLHFDSCASVVLSGSFVEAGFGGRVNVEPGDVLLHNRFDSHANSSPNGRHVRGDRSTSRHALLARASSLYWLASDLKTMGNLSLRRGARSFGMRPEALSRGFRDDFGVSPKHIRVGFLRPFALEPKRAIADGILADRRT